MYWRTSMMSLPASQDTPQATISMPMVSECPGNEAGWSLVRGFSVSLESQKFSVIFLPDGRPAPAVLTAEETISLLRLDGEHPERCLKYWRDRGLLRGVRLGKTLRYRLSDIEAFLAQKVRESSNSGLESRHS
jgi:hypothetical protein